MIDEIVARVRKANPPPHRLEFSGRSIPGWSTSQHVEFFHAVMHFARPSNVLVCGVYHGMDLVILDHLARAEKLTPTLTGIDLFSAAPMADWPKEKAGMTWEQAFNCHPPSMAAAQRNCPSALLIKGNSIEHLRAAACDYDFIYLDTSHDYATVAEEILAVTGCGFRGLLAGDDYHGGPADCDWGVAKACKEHLPQHVALFDRIWLAEIK